MNNKKTSTKAELFAIRMNRISRLGAFRYLPKKNALVEEFNAVECSFDGTQFRIERTMINYCPLSRRYKVL